MNCSNNITPCGCENNPCGCKTSSNDVVYQGPNLSCTGVLNCDTVTEVIQTIDGFICSPELVQTVINNIINNIGLYNQFTTIVNNTLDCQTVWNCIASSTTTTTTTICICDNWTWLAVGANESSLVYVDCGGDLQIIAVEDVTENNGTICVEKDSIPQWVPAPTSGTHELSLGGCCNTTTTTTTEGPVTINSYITTCNSYFWPISGETYFETDTPSITDGNITYVLYLTICSGTGSQITTETVSAPSPYTWTKNGQVYTQSGNFSVNVGPCAEGGAECTYYLELTII